MNIKMYYAVLFFFFSTYPIFSQLPSLKIPGLKKDHKALHFIVMGDWGRNGELFQKPVANWMGIAAQQVEAEFVISTGDNFYCCGVKDVHDPQWISSFEQVYTDSSLHIPWYPVLGNHDYQGSVQAQLDYSQRSNRWRMLAHYYTFAKKNARFIFLDTNPFISNYHKSYLNKTELVLQDTAAQWRWLDSLLAHRKEKWTFVVGHHPVHSTGYYGDSPDLVEKLKPRLEHYRVQIYFSGHDHDLQHQKPQGSNVHYLVSGGGLEGRESKRSPLPTTCFAQASPGFMVVALRKRQLKIYAINHEGVVIYQTIIK